MRNKMFVFIEGFGVGVLLMVLLGLIKAPWNAVIQTSSTYSLILQGSAVVLVFLSFLNALLKWFRIKNDRGDMALSYGLFLIGSLLFITVPSFFSNALTFPYQGFWVLVSYYSLPAILVEGALFNFFEEFSKNAVFKTPREKSVFIAGIIVYMITAVGTNFLTINHITTTMQHVWFSRVVILFVTAIMAVFHLRKKATGRI